MRACTPGQLKHHLQCAPDLSSAAAPCSREKRIKQAILTHSLLVSLSVQATRAAAVGNLAGRLHEQRGVRVTTPLGTRPGSFSRTAAEQEGSSSQAGREGGGDAAGAGSGVGEGEGVGDGAGAGDRDSPDSAAKPFLKRKSRKVVGSKIDWSHVKPRTVSR